MEDSIPEGTVREYLETQGVGPGSLVVLDFDGVICDSLPECYVSSWHAYRGLDRPHPVLDDPGAFGRFTRLRPFVRSGEDYLLIHEAEDRGLEIADQRHFDALIAQAGPEGMRERKRRLYHARDQLIRGEPDYWIRLNPIYPHVQEHLPALAACERAIVLSTKRADLVSRILRYHGAGFPSPRVLEPGSRAKLVVIRELMSLRSAPSAVFVDDQVDHFRDSARTASGVACLLAAWGYIQSAWRTATADDRVMEAGEAGPLLASLLAG